MSTKPDPDADSIRFLEQKPILKNYTHRPPGGSLFHYTSSAGLIGILRNRNVWASNQELLNDESEMTFSANVLNANFAQYLAQGSATDTEAIAQLQHYFSQADFSTLPISAYVASFSDDSDSLSQWERYADPNGYAVGFSPEPFRDIVVRSNISTGYPGPLAVVYDEQLQHDLLFEIFETAFEEIGRVSTDQLTGESLKRWANFYARIARSISMNFKHPAFKEEKEWRCSILKHRDDTEGVEVRTGRFGLVPYLELPISDDFDNSLSEIVVGPAPYPKEAVRAIHVTLKRFGFDPEKVTVSTSAAPLRI